MATRWMEKGDNKIPVCINNDLTDLIWGMIYKNLFFQEMCLKIGHSWGIQTIWRAILLSIIRWATQNKLKDIVGGSLSLNAFQDFYICLAFVFICFHAYWFLFLRQSSILSILWLILLWFSVNYFCEFELVYV